MNSQTRRKLNDWVLWISRLAVSQVENEEQQKLAKEVTAAAIELSNSLQTDETIVEVR